MKPTAILPIILLASTSSALFFNSDAQAAPHNVERALNATEKPEINVYRGGGGSGGGSGGSGGSGGGGGGGRGGGGSSSSSGSSGGRTGSGSSGSSLGSTGGGTSGTSGSTRPGKSGSGGGAASSGGLNVVSLPLVLGAGIVVGIAGIVV